MDDLAGFRSWLVSSAGAGTAGGRPRGPAPRRGVHRVVLVEGVSDQVALECVAARHGRDLAAEGTVVVPMGGVTNIGRFLQPLAGTDLLVAGLCDAAEERFVRSGLSAAGLGAPASRAALQQAGFFLCEADLEDELVRALGPVGVQRVLDIHGDLPRFRVFQHQPAQRGRAVEHQLRRFLGTTSGRKAVYARRLIEQLEIDRTPPPLAALVARLS